MRVLEIWRYPGKSMAGERLREADLRVDGIVGDRIVHVEDAGGRVITARTHPRLLGLAARLGSDGEPVVNGLPWSTPEVASMVEAAAGPGARLVRDDSLGRFDVLPLLVATDGSIAALGVDHRRLRPNLVIADVPGLDERSWPGHRLRIGQALIEVMKLRRRCVMTTYDPDTQAQDLAVLRRIVTDFDARIALDCRVLEPATIRVDDPVRLEDGGATTLGSVERPPRSSAVT